MALDFKGVEFGSSKEQLRHTIPAFACPADPKPKSICAISPLSICKSDLKNANHPCHKTATDALTYAGRPVESIIVSFAGDRMMSVSIFFGATEFEAITQAITSKHGKPANIDEHVAQNRYGAKYKNERWLWKPKGGVISAEKHAGKINESFVSIASEEMIAAMATEKAERDRASKSDM